MKHIVTRGLAVSAVSALALSGLTLASAPGAHAAGPSVKLLSQFTGFASVKQDQDYDSSDAVSTRLTARVAPGATVTFEVNTDPEAADGASGWQTLAIPVTVTGIFASASWFGDLPNGQYVVGERVALRAVATDGGGTSYSTRRNVEVTGSDAATEAVTIETASAGYFAQPYASTGRTKTLLPVDGTTSATDGTVKLSSWRDSSGAFTGQVAADVEPDSFKLPSDIESVPGGRFTGLLDITGFDAASGSISVAAERGSDDVAPIAVTQQVITTVTATANGAVPTGGTGTVAVRVTDADGRNVVGAEVRRLADGVLVGYTDGDGTVTAQQAGDAIVQYYANATDADPYVPAEGDQRSDNVTVPTYTPAATSVSLVLRDGDLFDVDEYAAGDIGIDVSDQEGNPVGAGSSVSYKLYPTSGPVPAAYTTGTTDADGFVTVAFDQAPGDYTLLAHVTANPGDPDASTTFTAGQATLVLNPRAEPAPAAAGGQLDYVGRLTIDGRPLAGRKVDLAYKRGIEVVPGNTADAAMLVAGRRLLSTSVVTNQNGSFRVTVDDLAEKPQATEAGGVLAARTGATVATSDETLAGNAGAQDTSTTRFGTAGRGTAKIVLGGRGNGAADDVLKVTGPASLAGERVKVFRTTGGKRVLVTTRRLNASGDQPALKVKDKNGAATTTYVVQLVASVRVQASTSNKKAIR